MEGIFAPPCSAPVKRRPLGATTEMNKAIIIFSLLIVGCFGNIKTIREYNYNDSIAYSQDTLMQLERYSGMLIENAYRLTILGNGKVIYESRRYGRRDYFIESSAVDYLICAFRNADLFSKKDSYDRFSPECVQSGLDQPGTVLYFKFNGKIKTVDHYYGCIVPNVTDQLYHLESVIDSIVLR